MDEVTVHVVDYTNNGHGAWTNPPTTTPDGSVATHWDIYIDPWSQDAADYAQHFGGNWQMALNYMVQHEFGHANQINYQFWTAYNGDANALQAQEVLADAYADGLNTNFPTDSGFTTFTGYHPGMIIMGGTSGPDVLEGTTQTAFITGGGGIDTVDYSTATAGIVADLTPRTSWPTPMNIYFGITNLSGSPYNDTLIGDANNNTITGGAGDDSIAGGDGNDYLQGNQGFDTINGNAGNDTIHGGADGDLVRGGQGNDYIIGDNSNDQIYGDVGNDTMTGGGGADAFYTQHGFGSDVITDFNQAEGDKIHVLGGASWTTFQSGANTVVQLDDGTVLTLQNVQSSTLTPGWIVAG
jgi:Ca2+-binding RTX toxin-like protein